MRLRVLAGLVLILSLGGCGGESKLHGVVPPTKGGLVGVKASNVSTSGESQPFELRARSGDLLVVYLGYTSCPDICPTTMADMRTAREDLGKDADRVQVAFVTVDPDVDTPEVLRDFMGHFGLQSPAGIALRPEAKDLLNVQQALHESSEITTDDNGKRIVAHMTSSYAVDSTGTVVDVWSYGTPAKDINHDLRLLLDKAQ